MAITKIGKTSATYKQIVDKEVPGEVLGDFTVDTTKKSEKDMWDLVINKLNEIIDKVNSLDS